MNSDMGRYFHSLILSSVNSVVLAASPAWLGNYHFFSGEAVLLWDLFKILILVLESLETGVAQIYLLSLK